MRGSGCGVASNVASQFTSGDRQMTCAQNRQEPDQRKCPTLQRAGMRLCQQASGEDRRHQRDRAQIEQQRKPAAPSAADASDREWRTSSRSFELRQSLVDQVEADMCRAIVAAVPRLAPSCASSNRFARHLAFGEAAVLSLSFPPHGGNGRGWQNPSCRKRRRDPRAASARQRSSSRRTRASPSRPENEGCRCCC